MLKFPPREKQREEEPNEPTSGPHIQAAEFQQFDGSEPPASANERERKLDLLMGLTLPVSIELGRTELEIRSVLDLKRGSIIEFDKMASEPVDIFVNGKKMAEGEVVVIDKHFAIRVTNLVNAAERIKGLGR
ncbi:MAG: flagellar motor switch protein FliN [Ignavibacteria bacterium]